MPLCGSVSGTRVPQLYTPNKNNDNSIWLIKWALLNCTSVLILHMQPHNVAVLCKLLSIQVRSIRASNSDYGALLFVTDLQTSCRIFLILHSNIVLVRRNSIYMLLEKSTHRVVGVCQPHRVSLASTVLLHCISCCSWYDDVLNYTVRRTQIDWLQSVIIVVPSNGQGNNDNCSGSSCSWCPVVQSVMVRCRVRTTAAASPDILLLPPWTECQMSNNKMSDDCMSGKHWFFSKIQT